MKQCKPIFLLLVILLAACAGQKPKIIFQPDPDQDMLPPDQVGSSESWEIIESQNGPGEIGIPEWVYRYYNRELRSFESQGDYSGKYVFVGRSQGNNFIALQQWARGFSATHDLPRLVAQRVERRLIVSASLYPDDEYGEFFANLIKKVSDSEYPGAVEEQFFWVRRRMIAGSEENTDYIEFPEEGIESERYEFLALISINKATLQRQLEEMMNDTETKVPPTRNQTAAINKIRQSFFEGF